MIIRVTNKKEGLAKYLRLGKGNTRDEKDIRESIHGDISTFEKVCEFADKHRSFSANYKHLTFSLSSQDEKILRSIPEAERPVWIKDITFDYLALLFPHRDPDELTTYIESHEPREKYVDDGERFYHWHVGVALLDPRTGNRLSACANVQRENAARQSHVCNKYGLSDPITFIDFDKNSRGKRVGVRKQVVDALGAYFEENPPENYEELVDIINQFSVTSGISIEFKKEKAGKIGHITILAKRASDGKSANIRLSGSNFQHIEHIYAEKWNTDLNKYGSQAARKSLKLDLERIRDDESFRQKHLDKAKGDFKKKNLNREFSSKDGELTTNAKKWKKENTYIEEIEKIKVERTKAQKAFYRVYGVSLNGDVLKNSSIFEDRKTSNNILWEPEHRLRIVDAGDRLTTRFDSTDEVKLKAAVHLMLEMAEAKGWDLETIEFFGDDDFKAGAERIRDMRVAELKQGQKVIRSLPDCEGNTVEIKTIPAPKEPTKITHPPRSKEHQKRTKAQLARLKRDVDVSLIVAALGREGLSVRGVTTNSQRHTLFEVGGRKYNSIDALTKLTKRNLPEAISYLEKEGSRSPKLDTTNPQTKRTTSLKFK